MYIHYEEKQRKEYIPLPEPTPNEEPKKFYKPRRIDIPKELVERLRKHKEITDIY